MTDHPTHELGTPTTKIGKMWAEAEVGTRASILAIEAQSRDDALRLMARKLDAIVPGSYKTEFQQGYIEGLRTAIAQITQEITTSKVANVAPEAKK